MLRCSSPALISSVFNFGGGSGSPTPSPPPPSPPPPPIAPLGQTYVLADGDSIFANGYFLSSPQRYENQYGGRVKLRLQAVSGSYIANVAARRSANLAYITSDTITNQYSAKIWVCDVGVNDMRNADDVVTFLAAYAAECDAYRAAGVKVGIGTLARRNGGFLAQSAADAWLATANAAFASWVGVGAGKHIDFLIDFASHSIMGAPLAYLDTSLYFDKLHPTDLGESYFYTDVYRQAVSAQTVAIARPSQYSPWSASDKDSNITLSNSDFTAGSNSAGGFRSVRGISGRESGKYQLPFRLDSAVDGLFGLTNLLEPLTNYFGQSLPASMYGQNYGGMFAPGVAIINAPGMTFAVGDWATWLIDFDLGKGWLSKNNIYSDGGSSPSGANQTIAFSPNTMFWPGFSPQTSSSAVTRPANAGQLPYGLETGYGAF